MKAKVGAAGVQRSLKSSGATPRPGTGRLANHPTERRRPVLDQAFLMSLACTLILLCAAACLAGMRLQTVLSGDGNWAEVWGQFRPAVPFLRMTLTLAGLMLLRAGWPALTASARPFRLALAAGLRGAARGLFRLCAPLRWVGTSLLAPAARYLQHLAHQVSQGTWRFLVAPVVRLLVLSLAKLYRLIAPVGRLAALGIALPFRMVVTGLRWCAWALTTLLLVPLFLITVVARQLYPWFGAGARWLGATVLVPAARFIGGALAQATRTIQRLRRPLRWAKVIVGAAGALLLIAACLEALPHDPCTDARSNPVEVCIYSSDTKQDWLNAVVNAFNAAQVKTASGKPVTVYAFHVNSGTSQQDILSGELKPTVWSPGDQSWVEGLNLAWQERHGKTVIPEACQATVYAPVGFAMWRPMAEALGWPSERISWDTLVALSADPEGWGRYGHPEWGAFKFGHTHPDHSNSGLLLLTALAYSTFDVTTGLTPEMVESQPFVDALRSVELNTYHYGLRSKDLLGLMVRRGPDYLHATNTSEADTLKTNREQAAQLRFPLVFIFPGEGTFWTEQPYCVLDAEWVSAEQREGAELFEAYLHEPAQQALAATFNLRPVDGSALGNAFTLENGTDPTISPETVPALASPSGEVAEAVKRVFHLTKKKATVLLVLDVSGSMNGQKIASARQAAANFVGRLAGNDQVSALVFNDAVNALTISGPAAEVAGALSETLLQQRASGGTALRDAVCEAVSQLSGQQAADAAASERRLYGIVVLSDGLDTASSRSDGALRQCLPTGEEVEGIKIFTIAYGSDADRALLEEIAARTNGRAFTADPETIEQVYLAISAEQ